MKPTKGSYPCPIGWGIDTPHIALLIHWGSGAEFNDPSQVPPLALPTAQPEETAEAVAFTNRQPPLPGDQGHSSKAEYGKG
ncbi:hypothetical protein C8255_02720 [filamentous cyanobacterium CCP3]|nr:hypothetical protein C8255_02720 [filamentous cyanobacterium CCP3]